MVCCWASDWPIKDGRSQKVLNWLLGLLLENLLLRYKTSTSEAHHPDNKSPATAFVARSGGIVGSGAIWDGDVTIHDEHHTRTPWLSCIVFSALLHLSAISFPTLLLATFFCFPRLETHQLTQTRRP